MEHKCITVENSMHQSLEFVIDELERTIVIGRLLSEGIEKVEIPDVINGKKVKAIGEDCFFNCGILKEVILPNTIDSIGAQAFALCKGLTDIVIPDSVKEIGHHAFRDCRGLKKVILPKGLKRIPVGLFSFTYMDNPEIVLPDGLEVIESNAFWSGGAFEIKIPDSVKEIGVGAFSGGPTPITKLPYDKGWFSEWPYGERVIVGNTQGRITDLHYLEGDCSLHEVTTGSATTDYFFPCDYVEGNIKFMDDKNQKYMEKDIKDIWREEDKLSSAYKIRDAWQKGII